MKEQFDGLWLRECEVGKRDFDTVSDGKIGWSVDDGVAVLRDPRAPSGVDVDLVKLNDVRALNSGV